VEIVHTVDPLGTLKMVLVNQCVDIDLKRHQLIATDILHAMPVTIVPDCT